MLGISTRDVTSSVKVSSSVMKKSLPSFVRVIFISSLILDLRLLKHTITLPSSPSIGDEISVIDYAGTFDTNNLTVGRNGENIQGSAADLTVATERAGFTLVYTDGTQGWLLKDK